jgi:uncharacterized protein YecE (DUF72 family)
MEIRIGCSSWTSPAWNGRFYPPGLPEGERISHYAKYFDTVEVDATYYAAPNPYVVRGWAKKTPPEFRFALKITRDLIDPRAPAPPEKLREFVATAELLGDRLGPILLQFPPWFRPGTAGRSLEFLLGRLAALPKGPRYAVELRDAGWFRGETAEALYRRLGDGGIALCWSSLNYVDVPPVATVPWAYVRFIGDHTSIPAEVHGELRADKTEEMRRWAGRLRAAEVESAFAFFNNHFAGYAPASANLFRQEMGLPALEHSAGGQRRLD